MSSHSNYVSSIPTDLSSQPRDARYVCWINTPISLHSSNQPTVLLAKCLCQAEVLSPTLSIRTLTDWESSADSCAVHCSTERAAVASCSQDNNWGTLTPLRPLTVGWHRLWLRQTVKRQCGFTALLASLSFRRETLAAASEKRQVSETRAASFQCWASAARVLIVYSTLDPLRSPSLPLPSSPSVSARWL